MVKPVHVRIADLRGLQRFANDAIVGLTDLVEAMHHTVIRLPGVVGTAPSGRTRGITGLVYRSVRGVTRLVGAGLDALLGTLEPLLAQRPSSDEREAVVAALNGVLGDYLAASGNALAIPMQVRRDGVPVALTRAALAAAYPDAKRSIAVLVHGLCMNDRQWTRRGHDHGQALAKDLGYTPVYLHYNTGEHISTSGRAFGDQLEALVNAWPQPVERLVILGHSMGGLVARSACHYAALAGHAWPGRLDALIFLGTPHLGAPLERAGARVDFLLGISPYTAPFARLGKVRSAGIKDLRHAYLRDEDWQGPAPRSARRVPPPLPLPAGVACYAIAGSTQAQPLASSRAPIHGDGLVPVNSALGRHRTASRDLAIPAAHQWVGHGMGHFDLLSRPEVYARIREWLAAMAGSERGKLADPHNRYQG